MTKLFISHAWEDKADLVEPLVQALEEEPEFTIWYDKHVLTMGDRLLEKISQGLRECDYGVVVLSKHFFSKEWPKNELDGLFALETAQRKLILPIWKDVTKEDINAFSPILTGRLGIRASEGIPALVSEIKRAVQIGDRAASFSAWDVLAAKYESFDKNLEAEVKSKRLASSSEGRKHADSAAKGVIDTIETQLNEIQSQSSTLRFRIEKQGHSIRLNCPFLLTAYCIYNNSSEQGMAHATFDIVVYKDPGHGSEEGRTTYRVKLQARPWFDADQQVVWKIGSETVLSSNQFAVHFLDLLLQQIQKERAR